MESKNCPYCKEEIKIDAIKCKHCGEFLEVKQFELNLITTIPYKNYYIAIASVIIAVISSLLSSFLSIDDSLNFYDYISIIAEISLLIYFRDFINLYNTKKTPTLINYLIFTIVLTTLCSLYYDDFMSNYSESEDPDWFVFLFWFILISISLFLYIKIGINLQRIKIKSLDIISKLGISFYIFIPISFILLIVSQVFYEDSIENIGIIISNIPLIMIGLLFIQILKLIKTKEITYIQINLNEKSILDKWYNRSITVVVLCIIVPPVGLYALFRNQSFSVISKLLILILTLSVAYNVKKQKDKIKRQNSIHSVY